MLTQTDHDHGLRPLHAEELGASSIRHGFFTRQGGVSQGLYAGLNVGLGSQDDPQLVQENRSRVAASLGVSSDRLACPWQVHSADALWVTAPFAGERPQADAVVTATPGIAVGVLTADCGPVLFADPQAGVVAAAHAGWKGALGGILENTLEVMIEAGAKRQDIRAVLGPCIGQESYEVGPEFLERFMEADPHAQRFFRDSERAGFAMFDLAGFILHRLERAGIQARSLGLCTYRDEDRFYSYRRSTHRGESDYGRQISAIAWMGS